MHPDPGPEIGIRAGDLIAEKYRVDRVLGVGGMGVVVAAHHLRLDELVAIKLLLPDALADADAVRRFEREARAAVKIKSEHVTRIIDVGTLEDGAPFIVMEYLEGEDLADRIARTGPLPVEGAIELLLQACEAIAEAHALGIVHRDLKPGNLFCVQGADGRSSIKVLDFGISKLTESSGGSSRLGMTKTRAVMGSPYYMSPEQMESPRTVDARTDIWSLGIVLYQMLTGKVPFGGETLPQVCVSVATRPAPPLRKIRPDAPNGLEVVVLRCLEKDPSKRFPTVAALATALARFGPRRAQASLDRITRIWQQAEGRRNDETALLPARGTDRIVTGPLPTWGGTAKPPEGGKTGTIGWVAGALIVFSAGLTFALLQATTGSPPQQAVLITPPRQIEPRETPTDLPSVDPVAGPRPAGGASSAEAMFPRGSASAALASLPTVSAGEEVALAAASSSKLPSTSPQPSLARPASATASGAMENEANPYGPSPEPPPPRASVPTCLLNLNSLPPAQVVVDGMPLGYTPKIGVTVPVGEHHILFRSQDGDKRTSVSCTKGETKTVAVRLNDLPPNDDLPEKNPYR